MNPKFMQRVCFPFLVVLVAIIVLVTLISGNRILRNKLQPEPACFVPAHSDPSVIVTPTGLMDSEPPAAPEPLVPLKTKDLIIRSVYWDNRPRGRHKSACVFMVEVLKSALTKKSIVSCKVGSCSTTAFKIRPVRNLKWVHAKHPECTHDMAMIDCFDMLAENGSQAYISYRVNSTTIIEIESERPLFIPAPRVPPKNNKTSTVMACAVIYGTPPILDNWLHYQRTIGVDYVYLIAEESFRDAGNLERNPLKEMMRSGYVSVEIWTPHLTSVEIFYHSQMLGYEDCIYRFQGTYDYVFTTDPDLFLILLVPGELSIQYYAENLCSVGSCVFKLIQFFLDCGVSEVGADGNVTAHLLSNKHFGRDAGKSLHKLSVSVDVGIHQAFVLTSGHWKKWVPVSVAYCAHISPGYMEKLPGGKC